MLVDVLATWNDSLLFTGRVCAPVRLGDLVAGAGEEVLVDERGAVRAPAGFERAGEGVVRRGDLALVVRRAQSFARGGGGVDVLPLAGMLVVSVAAHSGVLAAARRAPRDASADAREQLALMHHYLVASGDDDARPPPAEADEKTAGASAAAPGAADGTRARGEEGTMGRSAVGRDSRAEVATDETTPRKVELGEAAEWGMIGLLKADGDPRGPSAPRGDVEHAGAGASGTLWGAGVGDAFGAGGLGLSGSGGEGGGGRGEGIGLGTLGTLGHGAGSGGAGFGSGRARGLHGMAAAGPVQAGEWDDNANYREFERLLASSASLGITPLDVTHRQFLVVRDVQGRPIPNCPVTVADAGGRTTTLRTMASGRVILFPRAEGLRGDELAATARCGGNVASAPLSAAVDDGVVLLDGKEPRDLGAADVDVAFALDTTGSMGEEISAVQATLRRVAASLGGVHVGLVEYRDRTDAYVTRVFDMTGDVQRFAGVVSGLSAGGGGDMPEDVNRGLHDALTRLAWRPEASARLLFVIGDAPPHLDYQDEPGYAHDARAAAHAGVQVFTIAASGMDDLGQVVFRQIAQYTGGTELFVLRGGAGPQSVGGGDPLASCGGTQTQYTSGNLDRLIVHKIEQARRAMDEDPTRIAGLGQDENARPCAQRFAQR